MSTENTYAENHYRHGFVIAFSIVAILFGLVFDSPGAIMEGYYRILTSPSNLLTDYMAVGGIGAAFFNAGILMFLATVLLWKQKQPLTDPVIAALFTLFGFSLFGKNLFNTIPITAGVYIYGKLEGVESGALTVNSLFGTALGPAVSYICFGLGMPFYKGLLISYGVGILIGMIVPPLAMSFSNFHRGYTLYNLGFTCGIIGLFIQGVLKSFDLEASDISILSSGDNLTIAIFIYSFFVFSFIIGYFLNGKSFAGVKNLLSDSGKSPSSFGQMYGQGVCLMNMALLGIIYTTFILYIGQALNGPILGGIFTIFGFGIFGKHFRNVIPILIGAVIAFELNIYDTKSVSAMVTVLFATNLAPIAGEYGIFAGIVAGFAHVSIVSVVGLLHGGLNLYNNGLSGGFVAATLVPIYDAIRGSKFFRNRKK